MAGITTTSTQKLCQQWMEYVAARDANMKMVGTMLDTIMEEFYQRDPASAYQFLLAYGKDPGVAPKAYFVKEQPTAESQDKTEGTGLKGRKASGTGPI